MPAGPFLWLENNHALPVRPRFPSGGFTRAIPSGTSMRTLYPAKIMDADASV